MAFRGGLVTDAELPANVVLEDDSLTRLTDRTAEFISETATRRWLGQGTVGDLDIVNMSFAKIIAGALAVGQTIRSAGETGGTPNWSINGAGQASFLDVFVRGILENIDGNGSGIRVDNRRYEFFHEGNLTGFLNPSGGSVVIGKVTGGNTVGRIILDSSTGAGPHTLSFINFDFIDNIPPINATLQVGGGVVADSGSFNNHFRMLRSSHPDCEITPSGGMRFRVGGSNNMRLLTSGHAEQPGNFEVGNILRLTRQLTNGQEVIRFLVHRSFSIRRRGSSDSSANLSLTSEVGGNYWQVDHDGSLIVEFHPDGLSIPGNVGAGGRVFFGTSGLSDGPQNAGELVTFGGSSHMVRGSEDARLRLNNGELQSRDGPNNNYAPVRGSSFPTSSSRILKKDIEDAGNVDALGILRRVQCKSYRFRNEPPTKPKHFGPIAEELPSELLLPANGTSDGSSDSDKGDDAGYVINDVLWYAVRSINQLQERNEMLERRIRQLEALAGILVVPGPAPGPGPVQPDTVD